MDMAELTRRTRLPVRRLRYVADHRVMPGLAGAKHGVPRTFSDYEGFAIAVAASLLAAGLTRKAAAAALMAACRPVNLYAPAAKPCLLQVYEAGGGRLDIGDARHVRVLGPLAPGGLRVFDSGWLATSAGPAGRRFSPVVLVSVDLNALVRAVQSRQPRPGRG